MKNDASDTEHGSSTPDHAASVRKLAKLVHGIQITMLTTEDSEGQLRSRPMMTQQSEFDGDLWFFTSEGSPKSREIRDHQRVNLSYSSPSDDRYVSISGVASIVHDRAKYKELWNPLYKAWFPKGLDDPQICLIKVHVEKAEYWDTPSSKMVQLVGFMKSIVTGKQFKPGEHDKIDLAG